MSWNHMSKLTNTLLALEILLCELAWLADENFHLSSFSDSTCFIIVDFLSELIDMKGKLKLKGGSRVASLSHTLSLIRARFYRLVNK